MSGSALLRRSAHRSFRITSSTSRRVGVKHTEGAGIEGLARTATILLFPVGAQLATQTPVVASPAAPDEAEALERTRHHAVCGSGSWLR